MRFRFNPFRTLLIRQFLNRYAVRLTCVSEAHRQALLANGLDRFQVVYNGVDPAPYDFRQEELDAWSTKMTDNRPTILFMGRLSSLKGTDQLLDALSLVIRKVPDALLLVLAPDQGINTAIRARHPELEHAIRFGGWQNGTELLMTVSVCRVMAVPSICFDCLPTVALESMAASRPAVVSCFGGASEIIIHGETGYVVNPFDTVKLADYLSVLLADPDLANRLGEAGHRRLLERFTLGAQVTTMEAVYADSILEFSNRHARRPILNQ